MTKPASHRELLEGSGRFPREPLGPRVDGPSLYDLWNILVRWRLLIAAVAAAVVALVAAHVWLSVPRYEFRSGIELGYIYGGEAAVERYRTVESPEAAQARLDDLVIPTARRAFAAAGGQPAPAVRVSLRAANGGLLLISSAEQGRQSDVARLHTQIANALAEHHRPRLQQESQLLLHELEVQREVLAAELAALEEQVEFLRNRNPEEAAEPGVVALIDAQRLNDLTARRGDRQRELAQVQGRLDSIREGSRGTQLSFVASQSERPLGAGASARLVAGLLVGLLAGVLAAFLLEFVRNARRRRLA